VFIVLKDSKGCT